MNVVPDSGYYMGELIFVFFTFIYECYIIFLTSCTAPELLTGAALGGESTLFWEFGIFLYEVFTGRVSTSSLLYSPCILYIFF